MGENGNDAMEVARLREEITAHGRIPEILKLITEMEQSKALVIKTQKVADEYNEKWLQMVAVLKSLETSRKKEVAPYNKKVDLINMFFRELSRRVKPKADEFEVVLLAWRRKKKAEADEKARLAREEQARAEEKHEKAVEKAVEKGEEPPLPPPVTVPVPKAPARVQHGSVGASHTKKEWNVRVTDIKRLMKAIIEGELKVDPSQIFDVKIGKLKSLAKAGVDLNPFGVYAKEEEQLIGRTGGGK